MKPDYSRCYGITHTAEGLPVIREPKLLKVSIGAPKGKAIVVWMQKEDDGTVTWRIRTGVKQAEKKVFKYATRAASEDAYPKLLKEAPEAGFPTKLGFFTFTRPTADGTMEPDFDAIEAHGPMPTEIDVVFLSDDPFEAAYAMWSKTELQCKGDGINAERIATMATEAQKSLVKIGEKYFPIEDGCWTKGCQFSKPTMKGDREQPSACKPSGDLKFQLANNLRVGGTAYFHTTGFRSISQIFSSLMVFRTLTGGGDPNRGYLSGIPFRMVCRPYSTKHNGQAATQYGVSLEFRAETVAALKTKLLEQSLQFRDAFAGPRAISAPAPMIEAGSGFDSDDEDETVQAAVMTAEFYPEVEAEKPEEKPAVVAKTEQNTDALKERIANGKAKTAPTAAPAPGPVPVSNTSPAAALVATLSGVGAAAIAEEGDLF